jgi:hypothetical protein
VEWIREGEISFPRTPGEPDSVRAWRPWVLEEADATLRMWYAGSDGTTSRILAAERPPGGGLSLWFIGGPCEISLALANSPASETR